LSQAAQAAVVQAPAAVAAVALEDLELQHLLEFQDLLL
jgi:hypothetical protein